MVEKVSEAMDSSSSSTEVVPVEDVVQALLDYLVDPTFPLKSFGHEVPSLAQQQSVAKQLHAVVLLYNYYQRKRHAELEFLGFVSFCKLAVVLKPILMGHMKLMHRSDYAEMDDLEDQLSMTEKAIMNACDISLVLDASKDAPSTEGWPVSKVAVLLTDSNKDNCLLQFSSITHGVWSVIEKDLDISSSGCEGIVEAKHTNKRKRNTKKLSRDEANADEADFRQLALSTVKELTGINQSDLAILESHVVYSLSKEKTAAHFYIMQCTQSINENLQVPIKDVIESLQGPLVRNSSCRWTVTQVVEYFHVLPYARILTDWFSRKVFSNSLQDLKVGSQNVDFKSSQRMDNLCDKVVIEDTDDSNRNSNAADSVGNENENRSKSTRNVIKVYHHQKRTTSSADSSANAKTSDLKAKMVDSMTKSCRAKFKDEKADTGNKTCSITPTDQDEFLIGDGSPVPFQLGSIYFEKLKVILASKEKVLSQTALRVLLRKRNNLSRQLRNLEDEIAVCDKNLKTISDGGEGDLALKIEAIIDACNDVCLKSETETQERTCQHLEDQGSPQYRRTKLSEAILNLQNSCQELDDVCYENNWTLPTYCISPADGGFRANVTVKGIDFECSGGSDLCSSPRLARESAAAKMMAKLQVLQARANNS